MLEPLFAFLWGVREFRSVFTRHYEDSSARDAYDWGREWAHRITLRRYEP